VYRLLIRSVLTCSKTFTNNIVGIGGLSGALFVQLNYKITLFRRRYSLFTARCYASAVLAMALYLSVSPSVRLSVHHKSVFTKTAKRRITQTTPHDSPGTLVF